MDRSQRTKFHTTNLSRLHNCEQMPQKWPQFVGTDEIESVRISLTEIGKSLKSSLRRKTSSSQTGTGKDDDKALVSDVEIAQQWAAIERLPTFDLLKAPLFDISIYTDSALYEHMKALVRELSTPPPGSKDLHFPTRFAQSVIASLHFGVLLWDHGKEIDTQQSLFNIFGVFYVSVIFMGINNFSTAVRCITTERNVMYQERMYSPWAYSFAQVTVELPYLCLQAIMYVIITSPMIGFYWSAYKVFWVFYTMFINMMYYNYLATT